MIYYGIVEEKRALKYGTRTSYGIGVYDASDAAGATVLQSIPDITSDRESLEELVDRCNKGNLSEIHLEEAVQDFLTMKN